MRITVILLILFWTISLQAQKKFLDSHYIEIIDSADAAYYRLSTLVNDTIIEKTFFINDTLYEIKRLDKNKFRSKEGMTCEFYRNGNLKYSMVYKNNILNGEVRGYFENGTLRRIDQYKNGVLQNGKCYGIEGKDTAYVIFEKPARYMGGGLETFYQTVIRNVKYPKMAIENGVSGRVVVAFSVNPDGLIENVRAVESPDEMLSRAAEEAIKISGLWEPAEREGKKCGQSFYLPVIFNLGIK